MTDYDLSYTDRPTFERKTMPGFVKSADPAKGIVEHVVAVYGNVDSVDDVIDPHCFADACAGLGPNVLVLDQHATDTVLRVVGRPLSLREIGRDELPPEVLAKAPDATGGLLARTQYAMKVQRAADVFQLVAGGFLPECSIGYTPTATSRRTVTVDGKQKTVRVLERCQLYEYSNVLWGANPATATLDAKAARPTEAARLALLAKATAALEAGAGDAARIKAGREVDRIRKRRELVANLADIV